MKRFMLPLLLLLLTPQTVVAQRSADHFLGGAVILGETASACNASQKQALRWSSASNTIEMCDGNSTWRQIIATTGSDMPAAPSRDIGYFVLSHNTTTGNIGGIQSADSFCLNELTTYDWRGKADAQSRGLLNSTNVKAWLCGGSSCQNLNAWQIYQFAVANDPDKGGATISVENDSLTHNNTQNWSAHNYWGAASFFTGRESGGTDVAFSSTAYMPCQGWTYDGPLTSVYGAVGSTFFSDTRRWRHMNSGTCPNRYRLACMVHP